MIHNVSKYESLSIVCDAVGRKCSFTGNYSDVGENNDILSLQNYLKKQI